MTQKPSFFPILLSIVLLLLIGLLVIEASADAPSPQSPRAYLPVLFQSTSNPSSTPTSIPPTATSTSIPPTSTPTQIPNAAIIINHNNTDINQIPDVWINAAKELVIHYAHTSHGSQILSGLEWLENKNSKYAVNIVEHGTVLNPGGTGMRFYDGNNVPDNTYITPDLYWQESYGRTYTRSVANTGWFDFSLWTWCGQLSDMRTSDVQSYLAYMDHFETEYPDMRFILYTGHTDGTNTGGTLWRNNNTIRNYAIGHQKILFDFADIETYPPFGGGGPYFNDGDGYCSWCTDWCAAHPTYYACQEPPDYCAHTNGIQCAMKAGAFWWLMARLAGWDGTPAQ